MSSSEEDFDMNDEDDFDQLDDDSASDLMEEDEGFDAEMASSTVVDRKPYDVQYVAKSPGDLRSAMDNEIAKVQSIFDLDSQTATLLLRSFNWNREKLVERYMDAPEECLSKAGLEAKPSSPVLVSSSLPNPGLASAPPASPVRRTSRRINTRASLAGPSASASSSSSTSLLRRAARPASPPPAASESEFSCPICCLDYPSSQIDSQTSALGCGHRACNDCWATYLEHKIKEEGESVRIQCLESGCDRIVAETHVTSLVGEGTLQRYEELLNRTYVDDNPSLRWCPAPECEYAVECKQAPPRVLNSIIPTVTCACDQVFCFGCGHAGDHRPVICRITKLWLKKCADDSETANWISANTKECDKCHSTIEKNGGCNHMTCKKCKHEFCWVCMGPWSEHGTAWYNCNRYEEKASSEARDGQSKSRASLERYLHYYNRWANHELSSKLERDLYAKTEKKMEEMQLSSDLSWIEVQFAKKAVDTLSTARVTLKWTYAMSFYLDRNNHTSMFEDNQADLEQAVESLSELLEKPIEKDGISALRQQVTDKTVYVHKRHDILLDDALKGYLENRWQFHA